MTSFTIKQGDTKPSLEVRLTDENGEPRRLVDVETIKFHMRSNDDQELVVDDTAMVVSEDDGHVVYKWKDGDTSKTGRHSAEFEVHYSGGSVETFPNYESIEVYVVEGVA